MKDEVINTARKGPVTVDCIFSIGGFVKRERYPLYMVSRGTIEMVVMRPLSFRAIPLADKIDAFGGDKITFRLMKIDRDKKTKVPYRAYFEAEGGGS